MQLAKIICRLILYRYRRRILFALFICNGAVWAAPEKVGLPVVTDGETAYVVAEFWREIYAAPVNLKLVSDDQKTPEEALGAYYDSAKRKSVDSLLQLFDPVDGSRARLQAVLSQNPDWLKSFSELEHVSLRYKILWGDYAVLGIRLHGSGKIKKFDWREAVRCLDNKCKKSNFLDDLNDETRLFGVVEHLMLTSKSNIVPQSKIQEAIKMKKAYSVLPDGVKFNVVKNPHPVTLYFNLHRLSNATWYKFGTKLHIPEIGVRPEVRPLINFIAKAREIKDSQLEEFKNLMSRNWDDYKNDESIVRVNSWKEGEIYSSLFTEEALLQRISKWAEIQPLAVASSQKTAFVYFLARDALGNTDPVQLVGLRIQRDGSYRLVVNGGLDPSWNILSSKSTLQFLHKEYGIKRLTEQKAVQSH